MSQTAPAPMAGAVPVEFTALLHRLADASGEIIRPYFRSNLAITAKPDATPVTLADEGAERAIRDLLAVARPDDGVWGEEYGQQNLDAEWVWVIDPIDGTKAFVAGKPLFATLIALLHEGRPVLGVIDQPVLGERWVGGAGLAATFNGLTARTSACRQLDKARFNTTSPRMFPGALHSAYDRLATACRQITYGGDAYAYGLLASGHLDIVLEAQLKLHDFAALAPVIAAAGGMVTDWQGRPLHAESAGDVLASANATLHEQALALLQPH